MSATSLQKLQRRFAALGVEGFRDSPPPPVPASGPPNLPPSAFMRGNMTTIQPPCGGSLPPARMCEVQERDWFNSMELHPQSIASPDGKGQRQPFATARTCAPTSNICAAGGDVCSAVDDACSSTLCERTNLCEGSSPPIDRSENLYSVPPRKPPRKDSSDYVDMSTLKDM